jgi:FkbM family methyltransferase
MNPLVFRARQLFYRAGGPWWRMRVAERLGSQRFSKPAVLGMDDALAPWLPERGVFLEVGAHDGFTQSNTYFLERHRGWSGVLIEAVPQLAERCRRRRPGSKVFHCALVDEAAAGQTVTLRFGDLMSVVAGTEGADAQAAQGAATAGARSFEVEVPARTLTSVLEEASVPELDLMVLDVEGHELNVLRGLDFERFAPRMLLIEMLEMDQQQPAFDELLGERYEAAVAITPYDVLYVRRDLTGARGGSASHAHSAPS